MKKGIKQQPKIKPMNAKPTADNQTITPLYLSIRVTIDRWQNGHTPDCESWLDITKLGTIWYGWQSLLAAVLLMIWLNLKKKRTKMCPMFARYKYSSSQYTVCHYTHW